jgi:hypothetical protein
MFVSVRVNLILRLVSKLDILIFLAIASLIMKTS